MIENTDEACDPLFHTQEKVKNTYVPINDTACSILWQGFRWIKTRRTPGRIDYLQVALQCN